jgi:hypothetical protein
MIFHCFPNFGVGAFRFIHNPKVVLGRIAMPKSKCALLSLVYTAATLTSVVPFINP